MDFEFYYTERGNSDVKEWLDDLVEKANAGDRDAQELVKNFYYCVSLAFEGMPYSRPLTKGMFELRPSNSAEWHRIPYIIWRNKLLLLSEFRKKSGKTSPEEIKKAIRRMKDWIRRYGK
ncbi:type II toxin-antitoxin system RelE/ParE family toxin [Cohnella cellulosilytica]|uniref:Type II toxin-antitoxin system RelE/ParE family toxin n=1 Tax=Cohnella cellulosilytica TaxID=986710 RepID=A0ABW2FIF3_9BACL